VSVKSSSWIGRTINGRYRVEKKLGEGGMGHVLLAFDINIENHVVIKVPRRSLLEEPGAIDRFANEIRAMVKLAHPNIVRVTDVGTYDGLPFAVMQYLAGGSLEDRRSEFSKPDFLPVWVTPAAKALDFIHTQKYVHRDVKPGNILFDGHDNVFVSDFGIAKGLAELNHDADSDVPRPAITSAGMIVGTPNYMAPEVVRCEEFDGRADQYALAATVYELLSGKRLFEGAAHAAILVLQVTDEVERLEEVATGIWPELANVVHRGLSKDANRRYENCKAFAAAILAALDAHPDLAGDGGIVAPSPSPLNIAPKKPSSTTSAKSPKVDTAERKPATQPPAPAPIVKRDATKRGRFVPPVDEKSVDEKPTAESTSSISEKKRETGRSSITGVAITANSIGMGFSQIPAGEFKMGSPISEDMRFADEGPLHSVKISQPFWLGMHVVTVGQFKKFVHDTGYRTQAEKDGEGGWGYHAGDKEYQGPSMKFNWRSVGWAQTGAHPVVNVTWLDAIEFCRWLSRVEGRQYRLPTEAQWEHACRAGAATPFSYGATLNSDQANFDGEQPYHDKVGPNLRSTSPVGSYKANAWGLYDMHGNVWEWCLDGKRAYVDADMTDPSGPLGSAGEKIVRGGCWSGKGYYCRSATRYTGSVNNRSCNTGFRIVMKKD